MRDEGEPESAECSEGVGVAGLLYMWGKESDGRRKGSVCARWIPGRVFGVMDVVPVPGRKISDFMPGVKLMRVSFRCLCESR